MKKTVMISTILMISLQAIAQENLTAFDLKDVRLLDGPFKQAEQVDVDYILELDEDRLLAPFLKDAGLHAKKENYGNWESDGLDGHIGGHYLSALSMMYASTGDKRMKSRLDDMIDQLKKAQEKNGNGYVGGIPNGASMWAEIKAGKIRANGFGLNDRWVPLYNIHKTYAGLRDAYLFGGNEDAKEMLIALTDWMIDITKDLSDEQVQQMLISEHGGLNETFADVAAITGDKKYMELARRFSHHQILDPLVAQHDELTGKHANTQIPKVIGYKRIADLENDPDWNRAAEFFWDNVTLKRSVTIGGNSVREHFHPTNDFNPMIEDVQGPETCNTYNMLKLTKLLFLGNPQDRYMEFYERALYNHILSTQDPEKGGFVYFTPMRPGHYRVYSQPHECFWCCVGSGLENHAKYGEMIYAHSDDELYVNLFIASALRWQEKGVMLTQQTRFPDEPKTTFQIKTGKPVEFTLKLRYPAWVADGGLKVTVNGEAVEVTGKPGEYIALTRTWNSGDQIETELPMHIETEQLPDGKNYYSFRYGPIVLAAKTTDSQMTGLFANADRMAHVAGGEQIPLNEMPMIISLPEQLAEQVKPVPGKPLTFTIDQLSKSRYKNLQLIPFFRLHESRYIVYWQQETPENAEAMMARLAAKEAEQQKLHAATIDMIYPGEQQPESDHFIASKDSQMGIHKGRHWRDARGWFSYVMQDKQREAKTLSVMYFGGDRNRNFKILLNDTVIATVKLDGSYGNDFYTVEYPIPDSVIKSANGVYTVKFEAEAGSIAGGIYEVRLMK
ncbi:MAG: glycoside hydrolase family 127 protein [Pontiellaceae bacterium]|nr:glycoside hydrolase family 127 protein [Pontiellaceae bacterium]MBN2784482.1 glycoside hydrolase family 127 protein [Pontiellaceae bacterium]